MSDPSAQRLTGLLSAVALLLLLLMPVLASVAPMPAGHMTSDMAMQGQGHDHAQASNGNFDCWQQCLDSCTSHCAPVLTALPMVFTAGNIHGSAPPDLYQPLFPSGRHRPPIA